MFKKKEKKSPLKDKPLRLPGQSLDEKIKDLQDTFLFTALYPILLVVWVVTSWVESLIPKPSNSVVVPFLISWLIFGGIVLIFIYRLIKIRKEIFRLILARDGERIVAEELLPIIQKGGVVLHDIVGNKFNIDHVIISKNGIYVLETKTYSKPINKNDATVKVVNGQIIADYYKPERNPVDQAKALAKWVKDLIKESTGKTFPVMPVILFPGWFVEMYKGSDYWVMNPKNMLSVFISNEPVVISDTDLHLIVYHLTRYVKSH